LGKKRWRHYVEDVVERLIAVLEPDDVVIGGGSQFCRAAPVISARTNNAGGAATPIALRS